MNPKFPTSKRYRRHKNKPLTKPQVWLLISILVIGFWLFSWIGSSDPTPPAVHQTATLDPIALDKNKPTKNSETILQPHIRPTRHQKKFKQLSLPTQSSVPAKSQPSSALSLPDSLAPKMRKPDVDLTFYKELPRKKVILPAEPEKKSLLSRVSKVSKKSVPTSVWKKPPTQHTQTLKTTKQTPINPTRYLVQIAVFPNFEHAVDLVKKLRQKGADPRVVTVNNNNGPSSLFRVRLGPFNNKPEANKALLRWKISGQPAMIMKATPG